MFHIWNTKSYYPYYQQKVVEIGWLTQSLRFKGVKKDYEVMMANATKNNYAIYFHLSSVDFGRSGSHWVKW